MNNDQIIQELQCSFDSDYGVSQQLIDNVARLIQENEKLRAELEQEKEKNKELEEHQRQYLDGELITAKQGKFFEKIIKENYIRKDKIKEKIEEIKNYTYTSKEERQCQNYAIDRLKELMEVDNE